MLLTLEVIESDSSLIAASVSLFSTLKCNDYIVSSKGNQLVILGGSDTATILALERFGEEFFSGDTSGNMIVSKVMSDVLTVEECNKRVEEQTCDTYIGIIRSGQIVHAKGDIIIVGDVNPNGKVTAVGSIYVLGKLKGMAHAGVEGNEEAIIAASTFVPTHVSIAKNIEVKSNEQDIIHMYDGQLFAYVNDAKQITYDRIQEVRNIRPSLSLFKGGS